MHAPTRSGPTSTREAFKLNSAMRRSCGRTASLWHAQEISHSCIESFNLYNCIDFVAHKPTSPIGSCGLARIFSFSFLSWDQQLLSPNTHSSVSRAAQCGTQCIRIRSKASHVDWGTSLLFPLIDAVIRHAKYPIIFDLPKLPLLPFFLQQPSLFPAISFQPKKPEKKQHPNFDPQLLTTKEAKVRQAGCKSI